MLPTYPCLGAGALSGAGRVERDGVSISPRMCVDLLVAEQAKRSPDAVAVECGDERLTFAELERRAASLASYLRRLGVGSGRAGRDSCRAFLRAPRRPARDPEGGRGLCADRPGLPGRAPGLHARRRRRQRARDPGAAARPGAGRLCASGLHRPGLGGDRAHAGVGRGPRARAGAARLRHLHLGLDRPAQGRRDPAPRARELPLDDARASGPRAGRRARGGDDALVRYRRSRALPAADRRSARRDRAAADVRPIRGCWRRSSRTRPQP